MSALWNVTRSTMPASTSRSVCVGGAAWPWPLPSSKLYKRTGEPIWLERARAFATAAIDQVRGARAAFGRGRYSLWTGDAGFAVYLWHCVRGEPQFPTVDVL